MAEPTLESMGLTTTLSEVNLYWRFQKSIMLGPSKIGKTEFWAQGKEKTFFIKTEAGHNHVPHIGMECRSLDDFRAIMGKLLAANKAHIFPYDTVVLDTGDRMLNLIDVDCVDRGIEKYPNNEVNGVGDIPNGSGWFWRTCEINHMLAYLEELPCAVVIIFHVAQEEREDVVGRKYKCDTINLGGKAGKSLLGWADHILHMKTAVAGNDLVRKMVLKGTKNVEAGTRLAGAPSELRWGNDSAANYAEFRKLFKD